MYEARLNVVRTTDNIGYGKGLYGNTEEKDITEKVYLRDYDNRDEIAPMGIKATLRVVKVDKHGNAYKRSVFDITINRYYLNYVATKDGLKNYYCTFYIDTYAYEFNLYVDSETNEVKDYTLEEWDDKCGFEDRVDADNTYKKGCYEFVSFAEYLS